MQDRRSNVVTETPKMGTKLMIKNAAKRIISIFKLITILLIKHQTKLLVENNRIENSNVLGADENLMC